MSWHRQRAQAVQNLRKQSLEPKGLRMHDTDICILIEDTVRATGNWLSIILSVWEENAADQPGSLGDVLLHETAVAWLRHRLSRSTPKNCWEEPREENKLLWQLWTVLGRHPLSERT